MKTVTLSLMLALSVSNLALAQSGTAKKVDPAMTAHDCDMKGMDMKGMDMKGMDMKGMDMKGMDMKGMTREKCKEMMNGDADAHASAGVVATKHRAVAIVKNVDKGSGKVTLAHEPVKSLNWPAMTMGFSVKDKRLFDKLSVGSKVNVEFEKQGAGYVVTSAK